MYNQDTYGSYQTVSVFQRRPITTALSEDTPLSEGQCVVDLVCSSGLQVGDGLRLLELREGLSPDGVLSILRQHPTC